MVFYIYTDIATLYTRAHSVTRHSGVCVLAFLLLQGAVFATSSSEHVPASVIDAAFA